MFLDKKEFRKELRKVLEEKITLEHPIFDEVMGSEPNLPLLKEMAIQGYQLTKHFLDYVETLWYFCPDLKHRKFLLYNLFEEETGRFSKTKNHVTLMQDFMTAISITENERESAEAYPATKELIDYRMNLVKNRDTYHLGAAAVLIGSEGQNLETKAGNARHDVLPRLYNITQEDLLFFSVHQAEDVAHVQQGINLVADICIDEKMQHEALLTVGKTCDLFIAMYDEIYTRNFPNKAVA